MTAGEIEGSVTCGGQKRTEGTTGGGGGSVTLSFTTLSTIAVQAGQSQIVVSVLKSGSLVHLQLVQVHPGLCEIGVNKEENQMLMEEQQQLMDKLKKHEREVLSVVEKSQQKKQRKRRDEGLIEQRRSRKQEEEEGVHEAMVASLNEGWSLLLRLLERRQEVLRLASDFYCRSLEFAVSIDRIEDLQIRSVDQRPREVQLTYDSMRRELLEKSLQVLTSSSRLLLKLKQLQRTEALQRRGGVLQDEEDEEEECSQCSSGMALRLEQLVETLQDRRRRADQAVRVQLQQLERGIVVEEGESKSEDWSLSINEILDRNLQLESTSSTESTDLRSDFRTPRTKDLQPGSRSGETAESRSEPTGVVGPESTTEETKSIESGSRLGPKPESGSDLGSRLDENKDLRPESKLDLESGFRLDSKPGSRLNEIRNLQSRFKLNLTAGSGSDLRLDSRSEPTRDLTSGSRSDMQPGFGSDVKPESRSEQTTGGAPESTSEETKNFESGSRLEHESRPDLSGSSSDPQPGFRFELKPGSRPRETRNLQSGFKLNMKAGSKSQDPDLDSDFKSGEIRDLLPGSRSDMEPGSRLDVKSESSSETTRDVAPESTSEESENFESRSSLDPDPESSSDGQPDSGVDVKPGPRSKTARDVAPESRLEESASSLDPEPESDLRPESRLKETKVLKSKSKPDVEPGFRFQLKPGSRLKEIHNLQPIYKFSLKAGSTSGLKLDSQSEETTDLASGSDVQPGSRLDVNPESRSEVTPDVGPESTLEETKTLKSRSRLHETKDLQTQTRPDLHSGSQLDFKHGFRPKETRNLPSGFKFSLKPGSRSDLKLDSKTEETTDLGSGSRSDMQPTSRPDLNPELELEQTTGVAPESTSEETKRTESRSTLDSESESVSDLKPGPTLDQMDQMILEPTRDTAPESTLEKTKNVEPGSRLEETKCLQLESRPDVQPGSRSDLQPGSRLEFKLGSRPNETKNRQSGFKLNQSTGSRSDLTLDSKSLDFRDPLTGSTLEQMPESRSDQQPGLGVDVKPESRSEPTRDMAPESRSQETTKSKPRTNPDPKPESDLKPGPTLDQTPGSRSDVILEPTRDMAPESTLEKTKNVEPESRLEETRRLQPGSRLEFKLGSRPKETKNLQSGFKLNQSTGSTSDLTLDSKSLNFRDPLTGSTLEQTTKSKPRTNPDPKPEYDLRPGSRLDGTKETESRPELKSGSRSELENSLGYETQSRDDHAHQVLLTNQRQELLSSCERLVKKICSLVQQSSSVLSTSSAGHQLSEAEDALNTHLQLHTQAEAAGQDADNLKQMLDQIRALQAVSPSRTSLQPPSEPSRQQSPLRALTEQLKRGGQTRNSTAQPAPPAAGPAAGSLSPELIGQVDLVLKELQSLNMKIGSNLQLLKPYVTFLRTAQQVEDEVEGLREEQDAACWQETLQKVLTAQELGNNCINTVSTVSGATLNLQSVVSAVQKTMERLNRSKQEVTELQSQKQIQKQQLEHCRKHRERLIKTRQDLNCVSELLDSCTQMDLGSQLQTSKLLEQFSQARPHFTQLDAEVEYLERTWETQREVQDELKLKGGAVKEEDLSELLKLQKSVKSKIHESESILERSSSFHQTSQQLEALVQSDCQSPGTGSTGSGGSTEAELSRHKEEQQQIQNLFKTASTLKADVCTAVQHSGWTCFRVEQLEARLLSLDSLRLSWLNEAARREDELRRELLSRRLSSDINQLRDSFKELKKRFNNLKFNYQKRNDRTRNTKAVRNQLQQVELYEEKLQALRKRLQGVTARLGSEVKDGGVAREAEDAINELHRQMGDFERSVSEHQKTLEMTRRLQQAMEEYQFWCEEASATIARVSKFSLECRSTEAVSVLYQQFEKFVWPTVPQQEERISQIAELAVRLHGVEEGQRYIEKTVSKHSEMVESIRELSDGLMKLEAKLKLEGLKKKQKDGESEKKEDRESEQRGEDVTEEKDEEKEKEVKGNIKSKKKEQKDNRCTQEAVDMYELKETGHTPELTPEHDEKEVPVKRQTAAKRKPPLQKSRSLDADRPMDRQTLSSDKSHRQQIYSDRFTSTHTFSISCSPVETNRRIHPIHSQLRPITTEPRATPPAVIGPMFSDIQRQFQKTQETAQDGVPASCGSALLQDASAGSLSEADLHQQEVMIEDYFSNDEYECVSPDDISLPPLAETPESNMVQSDVEEGFCFSSHGVHISQYSHQCHVQSEHSGTGTGGGRQQRESSQTESCPTPPTSVHSSSRLRSESNSFVQSPLTVPVPSLLTSTLCTILKTDGTSTANIPQSTELSMDVSGLTSPTKYNPFHKSNTPDSSNQNNVPEPLSKDHNSQYQQPQRNTGIQSKITQSVASKVEILPQSIELNRSSVPPQRSSCPQPVSGPSPGLHRNMTPPQDNKFQKCYTTFPETFHGSEDSLHQDKNSSQTKEETPPVSKPYPLLQGETLPRIDPVPQTTDSALHKDSPQDTGPSKFYGACSENMPQDSSPPQAYPDSRSVLDQDIPSSKSGNETSSVSIPKNSSLTKATIETQQKNSHSTLHQAGSNLSSPQEKSETLPKNNSVSQTRGFAQSSKDTEFIKSCPTLPQTILQGSSLPRTHHESRIALDQDVPSSKISKEICLASMPKSSSSSSTVNIQQESPLSQSDLLPQTDPVSQTRGFAQSQHLTDSALNKDRNQDSRSLKSCATSLQDFPQEHNLAYIDSRTGLDQDVPFFQSIKEPSSISMPQRSNLITPTTATQQTVYHQSSSLNSHCNVPQTCTNPVSVQGSPFSLGSGDLPEAHVPHLPESNSFSDISISSSDRFSSKQSHQTVYSLHKSLTSTSTQQCVHDPGMTPISPAKPTAAPQPEFQTQALAQQANLHVTSLSSPPHVLTPDQDPNICQPMAIREEIKITPQIQGPSIPAPPATPQAQAESLPQGKASKPGPPCITRPLSRATVMEGSPVMLEVEVTGHPEPMLTWLKDGEVSATGPGRELAHEERKHLLFVPEAPDSDGGLHEAGAVCSCSSNDKWLVAQVFDIISEDWQTWFGTLCVLLWLIYLIVL